MGIKVWRFRVQRHSNFELNSFLTTLPEEWNDEIAEAIINVFHPLAITNKPVMFQRQTKDNASLTGHTDEVGDVTIKDKEVKLKIKGEVENQVTRVGYYKVKNVELDGSHYIAWHHFWASEIGSMNPEKEPSPEFRLKYDREALKPISLLRIDYVRNEGKPPLRILVRQSIESFIALLCGRVIEHTYIQFGPQSTVLYEVSRTKAAR